MELDDIKKLIDFDHECMDKVVNIHKEKTAAIDAIEKEKKEIADSTWREVNERLALKKAELDAKIQKTESESAKEYEEVSAKLKSRFKENHDKWLKEMYDYCING